jgi:hypothetical protein
MIYLGRVFFYWETIIERRLAMDYSIEGTSTKIIDRVEDKFQRLIWHLRMTDWSFQKNVIIIMNGVDCR